MHPPLFYIHGKDSGPSGFRAQFLKRHFPKILIPQLNNDVPRRLEVLDEVVKTPSFLVGSSLGGLTSLGFAQDHPERVAGMVLIAPAVGFYDPAYKTPEVLDYISDLVIPQGIPTHVIAARRDEIIPLADIESLIQRSGMAEEIPFTVFDEDHLLHSSRALEAQLQAIEAVTGFSREADTSGQTG